MLQTKTLYQLNEGQKCVEQARSWRLQKDTGALAIRNELDNQVVFQGTALLNDEGALVNEAYASLSAYSAECPLLPNTTFCTFSKASVLSDSAVLSDRGSSNHTETVVSFGSSCHQ